METIQSSAVVTKSRHTMFPLLVVLLLISYGLLSRLVVLQDRTIDSQRGLIRLLFNENLHLVATSVGLHRNPAAPATQNMAQNRVPSRNPSTQIQSTQIQSTQIQSTQVQAAQAPSTQARSTQAPSAPAPSTQVPVIETKPPASAKSGRSSQKAQKALPMRPPVEMTDPSDMRRVSFSI